MAACIRSARPVRTLNVPVVIFAALAALNLAAPVAAEPLTRVSINGSMTPVYFNDGDSFRIQAGPFKGAQARLSGYNTLESFGPVHVWGDWTAKELYAIAKLATLSARRGEWSCEGDGKKDGYGRLLLFCRDLAKDLISKGLAHNYSVDETPGDAELQEAQRAAMKARIGMWAHGVPRFIMTSLHAKSEGGGRDGKTSNRLISTADAHSDQWVHDDDYAECQKVCHDVPGMTPADIEENLGKLKEAGALGALSEDDARAFIQAGVEAILRGNVKPAFADLEATGVKLPPTVDAAAATPLLDGLAVLKDTNVLAVNGKQQDTCQVYVDFRRRFGGDRAVCLR
jgi:endonuclease YncB( thermonuclease family)